MNKKADKTPENRGLMRDTDLALGKDNYILMIIGFAIIILGFILMSGSSDIYSFRILVISPIVTVGGFVFEIYAIMRMPRKE